MRNVRTQVGIPVQSRNGMWAATFENWVGPVGREFLGSEVESGAVFPSEDEALCGARRALEVLERTGKYPNMCEAW